MVDYDSMFDRLLMLQQGNVPDVYAEPDGTSLVKAMAILGMLKMSLGVELLGESHRLLGLAYLSYIGCTGV